MNNFELITIEESEIVDVVDVYDLTVEHDEHSFLHESGVILHNSAIVVADKAIDSFIPLVTISGERATQYTHSSCEESGAVKMDYLTVNSLKDVESCLNILRSKYLSNPKDNYNINDKKVPLHRIVPFKGNLYDIYDLPVSEEVFETIASGDVETVFQLGTNSAKKGLKHFNGKKKNGSLLISSIDDGAAFIALDRPGPLDATVTDGFVSRNMLEEYAARAKGKDPIGEIQYISAELAATYGVIVYQEQLTKLYKQLTDCTGIEAEAFRGDIGKKKMDKVEARRQNFLNKASQKVGEEEAKKIWDQIYTFGQYGFNLSHAVSYFYTSYATAFLKHHFPLEWWCGVLQNAKKEEIEEFWPYCKHLVILPDIQHSTDNFYIKDGKIIAPLSIIKGLGEKAHQELVENAPYRDIEDFTNKIAKTKSRVVLTETAESKAKMARSNLNSGVIGKLIVSGVMDSLFPSDLDTVGKLEHFNLKLAEALNKKRPDKINEKYAITNPLQIYQLRKDLLSVYSDYLGPSLLSLKTNGVSKKTVGSNTYYMYYPEDPKVLSCIMGQGLEKLKPMPILNGKTLQHLNTQATIEEGKVLRVAVAGYVVEENTFSYEKKDKNKQKTGITLKAKKYTLDIDGFTKTFVKWPQYDSPYKLQALKEKCEKSIVIAILSKKKELNDFNLDAVVPIYKYQEE